MADQVERPDRIYIELADEIWAVAKEIGTSPAATKLKGISGLVRALASEGGEEREPNMVTKEEALDFAYARERLEADGINFDHADLHHIGRVFDRLTAWIEDNDPPDRQPESGDRPTKGGPRYPVPDPATQSGEGEDWPEVVVESDGRLAHGCWQKVVSWPRPMPRGARRYIPAPEGSEG